MMGKEDTMMTRQARLALFLSLGLVIVPAGFARAADESDAAGEQGTLARLNAGAPEEALVKALVTIEEEYPDSADAAAKVLPLVRDERVKVRRKAVRVLGVLQPDLDAQGLAGVTRMLASNDSAEVIDALKGLRGLYAAASIPAILPLLGSPDEHVKREACRTLAVVGDKSVIARIEPLRNDPVKDVRTDADGAITQLRRKP
jgi:HEAT repeat protein